MLAGPAVLRGIARAAEQAPQEIAVIVHPDVKTTKLERAQLAALFTVARTQWDDGAAVIVFTHPPESPLRRAFDKAALGLDPDQVGQFWVDQRVRGGPRPPRQIQNPALTVKLVARLPGAISFVDARAVDGTVRVVARVRDGKVVNP